jgi:hypothetical protein
MGKESTTRDPNHPIEIASRSLESAFRAQKERGGPDYRYWEDDLAPAISNLAFAIVDEILWRIREGT